MWVYDLSLCQTEPAWKWNFPEITRQTIPCGERSAVRQHQQVLLNHFSVICLVSFCHGLWQSRAWAPAVYVKQCRVHFRPYVLWLWHEGTRRYMCLELPSLLSGERILHTDQCPCPVMVYPYWIHCEFFGRPSKSDTPKLMGMNENIKYVSDLTRP